MPCSIIYTNRNIQSDQITVTSRTPRLVGSHHSALRTANMRLPVSGHSRRLELQLTDTFGPDQDSSPAVHPKHSHRFLPNLTWLFTKYVLSSRFKLHQPTHLSARVLNKHVQLCACIEAAMGAKGESSRLRNTTAFLASPATKDDQGCYSPLFGSFNLNQLGC